MKLHLILLAFLMIISACKKKKCIGDIEDDCSFQGYYYYQDEKNDLGNLSNDYLMLAFDSTLSDDRIMSIIKLECSVEKAPEFEIGKQQNYPFKYTVVQLFKSLDCNEITSLINKLNSKSEIAYAHYTIQTDDCSSPTFESMGDKCVFTNSSLFYVSVKDPNNLEDLNKIASETNTEIVSKNQFMPQWFTLRATKESLGNSIEMANYFYKTSLFNTAEPDIIKVAVE